MSNDLQVFDSRGEVVMKHPDFTMAFLPEQARKFAAALTAHAEHAEEFIAREAAFRAQHTAQADKEKHAET